MCMSRLMNKKERSKWSRKRTGWKIMCRNEHGMRFELGSAKTVPIGVEVDEFDMRPDYAKHSEQYNIVADNRIVADNMRLYQTGFHIYLTKPPHGRLSPSMHGSRVLVKVKFRKPTAFGYELGEQPTAVAKYMTVVREEPHGQVTSR